MTGGFRPPHIPTFWEQQERQAERNWESLIIEIKRFHAKVPEGSALLIFTASDPSFHVVSMRRNGDNVILEGVDSENNPAQVVQHRSQLNIRMQTVPTEEKPRGAFGFIQPD